MNAVTNNLTAQTGAEMLEAPWTREEFEEKLREKGKGYHIYHPSTS